MIWYMILGYWLMSVLWDDEEEDGGSGALLFWLICLMLDDGE